MGIRVLGWSIEGYGKVLPFIIRHPVYVYRVFKKSRTGEISRKLSILEKNVSDKSCRISKDLFTDLISLPYQAWAGDAVPPRPRSRPAAEHSRRKHVGPRRLRGRCIKRWTPARVDNTVGQGRCADLKPRVNRRVNRSRAFEERCRSGHRQIIFPYSYFRPREVFLIVSEALFLVRPRESFLVLFRIIISRSSARIIYYYFPNCWLRTPSRTFMFRLSK